MWNETRQLVNRQLQLNPLLFSSGFLSLHSLPDELYPFFHEKLVYLSIVIDRYRYRYKMTLTHASAITAIVAITTVVLMQCHLLT